MDMGGNGKGSVCIQHIYICVDVFEMFLSRMVHGDGDPLYKLAIHERKKVFKAFMR